MRVCMPVVLARQQQARPKRASVSSPNVERGTCGMWRSTSGSTPAWVHRITDDRLRSSSELTDCCSKSSCARSCIRIT